MSISHDFQFMFSYFIQYWGIDNIEVGYNTFLSQNGYSGALIVQIPQA